ncbi:MAG: hypothetical protein WCF82_13440, partial [Microcoleus sp.]
KKEEGSSATDSVTDVTDVRKKEEGSSATDSVTDVTDVTDVSPMSVGRRKKEEGRDNSQFPIPNFQFPISNYQYSRLADAAGSFDSLFSTGISRQGGCKSSVTC